MILKYPEGGLPRNVVNKKGELSRLPFILISQEALNRFKSNQFDHGDFFLNFY